MTAEWHPAFEEYCETIFELSEEGVRVVQARISERLGISRPSVSGMVKRLAAEGLVHLDGAEILLTDDGRALAERVVRRHRLAERFLCDVLGLPWAEAHHEAGKWEHVIGPAVEDALVRVLGNPTTCPHGNPIPGADYLAPDMLPLGDVQVGAHFTITRIPEELEFEPGMLDFLEQHSLQPGHTGVLTVLSPDGTATVEVDGAHVGVPAFATKRILVTA